MAFIGIVAGFATAHCAFEFGGYGVLGALSTCKVVVGFFEILTDIKAARIVKQMIGGFASHVLLTARVVEREMTIHALQLTFGMDVPRSRQFSLIADVHARFGDFLSRNDLAGSVIFRCRTLENKGVAARVYRAMALRAVLVSWVLQRNYGGFHFAIFGKGFRCVSVTFADVCQETSAYQRSGGLYCSGIQGGKGSSYFR